MSRSKDLARNTMILTVGKLCTQFVSFFLLPLYTALLDTAEFGIVDLFTTYVTLLLPLVCWQLDQGLFRFMLDMRGKKSQIAELFSSIAIMNVLQCGLFSLVFFVAQMFISSEYKIYLWINVLLSVMSGLLMQFARGLGKTSHYAVGSFLTAVSTIVLNIVFLVFLKMGACGMFRATLLALCVNVTYLSVTLKIWNYFRIKKFNGKLLKQVLSYSIPLVPNQISGWILSASDRTIVSWVLGLTYNGIYAIAYKFSSIVATFYGFFNMAWVETVAIHFKDEDRDSFLHDMMQTAMGFFCSVCLGIIAIMPFAFPLMIDHKYDDAFYQIPILLVAVVFQIAVGLFSAIYLALKKSATIAKTTFLGAVINIAVHILLIKFIGLYAASVSTLVSYATVAIYRNYDVKKLVNYKWGKQFVLENLIAFVIVVTCYYLKSNILNVTSLVFAVLFALYINRKFISLLWAEGLSCIKKL